VFNKLFIYLLTYLFTY